MPPRADAGPSPPVHDIDEARAWRRAGRHRSPTPGTMSNAGVSRLLRAQDDATPEPWISLRSTGGGIGLAVAPPSSRAMSRMTVSHPNDPFEREAEEVAARIVSGPGPRPSTSTHRDPEPGPARTAAG